MSISAEQEVLISGMLETYVLEHHRGDLIQLLAEDHEETHQPLVINAMTLFEASMEVGDYLNAYPSEVLSIFDKVLHKVAMDLSQKDKGQRKEEQRMSYTLHARITGLPVCPELTRDTIPRCRDVGHFLSVNGTVIRTSVAKVLEYERDYMCAKCRHVFTVQADFDQFYSFVSPAVCPNPDGCNSFKFSCLSGESEPVTCRDYQEIKIQEQVQRLSVGSIPRSLVVVLEDDLVDTCKSGDDVTVYGVMRQRWKPFTNGTGCDVELVLKANNLEVNNQQSTTALIMEDVQKEFTDFWDNYKNDPIAGRNQILLSLCPQVFGMYVIKLAVAMVLAGGVQRIDPSGTKIRGECHMLLVGDPGTGKSQFLKYAAKIMPRSVLTAGIGSTSAGLTVAAVKDGGEWHLEAGALVLSDGGLCCIDEFNSIKEHDRISIHEAMEQQSISVAKAGMVCKLNTRTTILAATNPKGRYDPAEPLSVNVALASPLLSRFDLVLVLLDTRNKEWDRIISAFILEDRGLPSESSSLWSMEKMKAYFCLIKRLQPQVSDDANCIISTYYQLQRQSEGRNAARTTIRMLESLSRLAEAHARLMYRETVTIEDAVMAVSVMECSMQGGGLLGNVNAILTSFPDVPQQQYRIQCQTLLERLDLPILLQKEMDRLARLKIPLSQPADRHPIAETHLHSVGLSDTRMESGMDWFHSITTGLSPEDTTSPVSSSTQRDTRRQSNSSWSEISSVLDADVVSRTEEAVSTSSEETKRTNTKQRSEQTAEQRQCAESVTQKVSKSLRDRRIRELKHQQCDNTHTDYCHSDKPTHGDNTSHSGRENRRDTGTSRPRSGLREKMAAQSGTGEDIHAKLSGFTFKPRKMRTLVHNHNPHASDASAKVQTEGNRTHTQSREGQQKAGHHESVSREKAKPSEGGGMKSCGSEEVDDSLLISQEKVNASAAGRFSGTDNTVNRGDETETGKPPLKPGCKSAVTSSTLAKLSRFSFTAATEPTTTAPAVADQRQSGVNHCQNGTGSPGHSPPRKTIRTAVGMKPSAVSEMTSEPVTRPTVRPAADSSSSSSSVKMIVDNVKKRKCFELAPPPRAVCGSSGPFSNGSLFHSEFNDDVLDIDWDQEILKTAKV